MPARTSPPDRHARRAAMPSSLPPPCSGLRPWHTDQPAAGALTVPSLAASVPACITKEHLAASWLWAARYAGTPDKGLHGTAFSLASRHLPDNPCAPEKAFPSSWSRTNHLTSGPHFTVIYSFVHSRNAYEKVTCALRVGLNSKI